MTPTKFTPGPWRVDGTKALGAYGVWTEAATHPGHDNAGYPSQVANVYAYNESHFDRETRDANAALIAAAPDLYAACERTFEILESWGPERRGHTLELLHARLSKVLSAARPTQQP